MVSTVILRPQDFVIALKFAAVRNRALNTVVVANEVGLTLAQTHEAIGRAIAAHLLVQMGVTKGQLGRPAKRIAPSFAALIEFAIHGARYVFVPERGKLARGMPTSVSAPPLRDVLLEKGPPLVWPDPKGKVRGETFSPLHPCAVHASAQDPELYALLTLVDALRDGTARDREFAADILKKRLASA